MKQAFTFDDVFIVPGYSEIESRQNIDLSTKITKNYHLKVPFVSAPMDSVTWDRMATVLWSLGAAGALHRFAELGPRVEVVNELAFEGVCPIVVSVGVSRDEEFIAERLIDEGADIILVDVAHGDHAHVKRMLRFLKDYKKEKSFDIIAGNIATADAAKRLEEWGADALRVGIGGGSLCTTRVRTGVGVPQFTAIQEVAAVATVPIIADGGIRSSGDIVKALAAGADTVMIGSLLSGTDEAPGDRFISGEWPNEKKFKVYRGSASMALKASRGEVRNVEGTATLVPLKGSTEKVISILSEGVRSGMSYVGASNLKELRERAQFVQVTNAGLTEALPHGLKNG